MSEVPSEPREPQRLPPDRIQQLARQRLAATRAIAAGEEPPHAITAAALAQTTLLLGYANDSPEAVRLRAAINARRQPEPPAETPAASVPVTTDIDGTDDTARVEGGEAVTSASTAQPANIDTAEPARDAESEREQRRLVLEVSAETDGIHEPNEDALVRVDELGFFGVLDGVSGQSGGDIASHTAQETLERRVREIATLDDDLSDEQIIELFSDSRDAIRAKAKELGKFESMSSTGALAKIWHDKEGQVWATVGWRGDSRFGIRRADGSYEHITLDHSEFSQRMPEDAKRLWQTAISASTNPQALLENYGDFVAAVDKAWRDPSDLQETAQEMFAQWNTGRITEHLNSSTFRLPSITRVRLNPGDVLLGHTDGLNRLTTGTITQIIGENTSTFDALAPALIQEARNDAHHDEYRRQAYYADDIAITAIRARSEVIPEETIALRLNLQKNIDTLRDFTGFYGNDDPRWSTIREDAAEEIATNNTAESDRARRMLLELTGFLQDNTDVVSPPQNTDLLRIAGSLVRERMTTSHLNLAPEATEQVTNILVNFGTSRAQEYFTRDNFHQNAAATIDYLLLFYRKSTVEALAAEDPGNPETFVL